MSESITSSIFLKSLLRLVSSWLVPLATAKIEKKVAVTEYLFKQFHSKHCLNVSKAHGFLRYDTHFHLLDFL